MARSFPRCTVLSAAVAVVFVLLSDTTSAEEVGLVKLDVKDVAKGYRGEALKQKTVVNDKGEDVGRIDDFIFARNDNQVFAVLSVGDYVGVGGSLVAVPLRSLKLDDPSGSIVLPGADRAALLKLPVFLYNR
jgi:hypothetical protein